MTEEEKLFKPGEGDNDDDGKLNAATLLIA